MNELPKSSWPNMAFEHRKSLTLIFNRLCCKLERFRSSFAHAQRFGCAVAGGV